MKEYIRYNNDGTLNVDLSCINNKQVPNCTSGQLVQQTNMLLAPNNGQIDELMQPAINLYADPNKNVPLELQKQYMQKNIELKATIAKEMIKSDVAEKRKLQITSVTMQKGKKVRVIKEQFGADLEGTLPYGFVESKIYVPYGEKTENGILYGCFTDEMGRGEKRIYFLISELDDSYIRKKFRKSGIILGFSFQKETEIKNLIVEQMRSQAIVQELPYCPGWNEINGQIKFVFPEELTWKEVLQYARS